MLNDKELKELAEQEIEQGKEQLPKIEEELKILLIPKDPDVYKRQQWRKGRLNSRS